LRGNAPVAAGLALGPCTSSEQTCCKFRDSRSLNVVPENLTALQQLVVIKNSKWSFCVKSQTTIVPFKSHPFSKGN